jgi:hypothetical protein
MCPGRLAVCSVVWLVVSSRVRDVASKHCVRSWGRAASRDLYIGPIYAAPRISSWRCVAYRLESFAPTLHPVCWISLPGSMRNAFTQRIVANNSQDWEAWAGNLLCERLK